MKEAVILKSNKYGLQLILNGELPFETLKEEVVQKFKESKKFFKDAQFAISFAGRDLTDEEECALVSAINENSDTEVICIVDEESIREEIFQSRAEQAEEEPEPDFNPNSAFLRYDSLTEDEVLIVEENLVIMGDVPESATVTSGGSIVVLGSLSGKVWAGSGGNEDAFIFALSMQPASLRIGGVVLPPEEHGIFRRRRSKTFLPKAARISGGMVILQEIVPGRTK
ncbi:MAG: septum formation inhibitor [Lachnospiraceae bacterium]|nr:septum formation inhibitor [Lachnospiraceae bacterium]